MIIITGMHRSGTTFLSRLINCDSSYSTIHEPLNRDYGIVGNEFWYPYFTIKEQNGPIQLLDDLYNLNVKFKTPQEHRKKLTRRVFKSAGNIDLIKHRLFNRKKEVVLKDPFLSLSANYLANQYDDVKIIYIVRHPVAIYNSVERMNWDFNFDGFNVDAVLTDYPEINLDLINGLKHEKIALLWSILYSIIYSNSISSPFNSLIIRHEDLSTNPHSVSNDIFQFLNKDCPVNLDGFIEKTMNAKTVNPIHNKQFDFTRNSQELVNSWKNMDSEKIDRILSLTNPIRSKLGY